MSESTRRLLRVQLSNIPTERAFTPEERLLCAVLARALNDALRSRIKGGFGEFTRNVDQYSAIRWLKDWNARKKKYPLTIRFVLESLVDNAEETHREIVAVLDDPTFDPSAILSAYGFFVLPKKGSCGGKVL